MKKNRSRSRKAIIPNIPSGLEGLTCKQIAEQLKISNRQAYVYLWMQSHGKIIEDSSDLTSTIPAQKVLFAPDLHLPHHSSSSLSATLDHADEENVDTIIFGGDTFDCHGIGSFPVKPGPWNFAQEVQECKDVIHPILEDNKGRRQIIFLEGNHEDRLRRYLWKEAKSLAGVDGLTISDVYGLKKFDHVKYISNSDLKEQHLPPFHIGNLWYMHGHETKVGGTSNLARRMYQKARKNVIYGHFHKNVREIFRKWDDQYDSATGVGCLQRLNPQYAPAADWCHGFAIITHYENGMFKIEPKVIINGRIV